MVNQDENQMLHARREWNVWPLWSIYANTLAPHSETEWWELLELHPMVVCWLVGHWPISYLTDKGYTCHWLVSTRGASEHYSDISNHISSSNISLAARVILGSFFLYKFSFSCTWFSRAASGVISNVSWLYLFGGRMHFYLDHVHFFGLGWHLLPIK